MDLCTLYLHRCHLRVTLVTQVFVVVFALCISLVLIHLFLGFERTINRKGSQLCLLRQDIVATK